MSQPLPAQALELCTGLVRALHEHGDEAWHHVDLTLPQLRCLFVIARHEPLPMGGVARALGVQLSTTSSLVDRLVEAGLVQRREDPRDRRRTLASTTAAGAALVRRLRQGSLETLQGWLDAMSAEDLGALVQGLEALARAGGVRRGGGEAGKLSEPRAGALP
ncbi:MAG TPA: MarR family transcriptional regulator [Candidatus Dormibacteraeota bacterium]|jgi:DNA-binding MarR family transcriptional regulator|nr:MarR family transcriptional regulator [Candidatus Dormibacteraeota bacterium]